jgi:hypothetical protein
MMIGCCANALRLPMVPASEKAQTAGSRSHSACRLDQLSLPPAGERISVALIVRRPR